MPVDERTTIPTRYGDPAFAYPPAAFDRIVISPGLSKAPWKIKSLHVLKQGVRVDNVYVHPGQDSSTASDHYPFFGDLVR